MTNELGAILYAAVSICIVFVAVLNARTSKYGAQIEKLQHEIEDIKYRLDGLDETVNGVILDEWDD